MAIVGTSTGGGMTLAMILRAKQEGLRAAGRDRAGYALVRSDGDRRQLQDQRMAGQCARQLQRIFESCCSPLCQRPRPEGSTALADLWRLPWFSAHDPDHRNARFVFVKYRPNPSQTAGSRRRGRFAGVRGFVACAISVRSDRRPKPRRRSKRSPHSSIGTSPNNIAMPVVPSRAHGRQSRPISFSAARPFGP